MGFRATIAFHVRRKGGRVEQRRAVPPIEVRVPMSDHECRLFVLRNGLARLTIAIRSDPPSLAPGVRRQGITAVSSIRVAIRTLTIYLAIVHRGALFRVLGTAFACLRNVPCLVAKLCRAMASVNIGLIHRCLPYGKEVTRPTTINANDGGCFRDVFLLHFGRYAPDFRKRCHLIPTHVCLRTIQYSLCARTCHVRPFVPRGRVREDRVMKGNCVLVFQVRRRWPIYELCELQAKATDV